MEDSGSRASLESSADDFVMVGGDPKLQIEGGVSTSGLKEDLKEILSSEDSTVNCDEKGTEKGQGRKKLIGEDGLKEQTNTHEFANSNESNNIDSDHNDDSSYSNIGSDVSNANAQIAETPDKKSDLNSFEFPSNENNHNCQLQLSTHIQEEFVACNDDKKSSSTLIEAATTTTTITEETALTSKIEPSTTHTSVEAPLSTPPHVTPPHIITMPTPLASTATYVMDDEAMLFTGVLYLGYTSIQESRSELEVNRIISLLNSQSQSPLLISLSIPSHSDGTIYLVDPPSNTIVSSHPIHQILFCARGATATAHCQCFAFTCSHVLPEAGTTFHCHVFRTDEPHVNVGKILYHFATAFRCTLKASSSSSSSSPPGLLACDTNEVHVSMAVDIKELDSKGSYVSCPKDKDVFKLRCNVMKQVVITLSQVAGDTKLAFKMCFGVLLTAGRNVKINNMSLLDVVGVSNSCDNSCISITASFDPTLTSFELINTLTPKDSRVFLTVAVDVVAERLRQPLKFLLELKAIILPASHNHWYFSSRQYADRFVLFLKESDESPSSPSSIGPQLEVVSMENQSEKERKKNRPMISSVLSMFQNSSTEPSSPQDAPNECEFSDNDEPLLSGSGVVSKEVTDDSLLQSWKDALFKWHQNVKARPRGVGGLVRKGVPEALRGEVWQLLVGCTDDQHMFEAYRLLISQSSPCDDVITRDLNRTFPAHEFFQDGGGTGQESLYRICKAYSIYDTEVSYCQGVSFLTAALLLHMPEEQAFCVLVRTMYTYRLRELFRMDFEDLHLKFFQLERCIEDQMANLFEHFVFLGLEAHMYASQWFLTLFTAKFPLFLVFCILDLFFSEGMPTIFAVALALLKMSRRELLALDFEGVLKYFRVQLPKKYRSEEAAREMMACAISMMPSERKLKRFETLYKTFREEQMIKEEPTERLKKDNKRLQENNLRLERENDSLARELVNSKIQLRSQLDEVEDKYECVNKELLLSKSIVLDAEEEVRMQLQEITQLKDLCRRESQNVQKSDQRNQAIMKDYKKACTQLSSHIESMAQKHLKETQAYKAIMEACEGCREKLAKVSEELTTEKDEKGAGLADEASNEKASSSHVVDKDDVIRCLELELAQTKLALVECECRNQDLMHQLTSSFSSPNLSSLGNSNLPLHSNGNNHTTTGVPNSTSSTTLNAHGGSSGGSGGGGKMSARNSWLQKTLNSIKEATVVKASAFNT